MLLIRKPKDFISGILFLAIGTTGMIMLRAYQFGTPRQMGPGFLPSVLAGLLIIFAVTLTVRSFLGPGEALGSIPVRAPALILGGALLFALLLRPAGLAIAIPAMILTGSFASSRVSFVAATITAAVLTTASCVVFVYALRQPIPVLGYWFGS